MKDLWKIGRASAIGSAAFVAIALLLMPSYWIFGLIAGAAGGYIVGHLGYNFSEVVRATPAAFDSLSAVGSAVGVRAGNSSHRITVWFKTYQAHIVPGLVAGAVASPFLIEMARYKPYGAFLLGDWAAFLLIAVAPGWILVGVLGMMTVIANDVEGKPGFDRLEYGPVLRDNSIGFYWLVAFLFWYLWKGLWIGFCDLLRKIHSAERVACGFDSVLGGVITLIGYVYFGPSTTTLGAYLLTIGTGALVGGAVGLAMTKLFASSTQTETAA